MRAIGAHNSFIMCFMLFVGVHACILLTLSVEGTGARPITRDVVC